MADTHMQKFILLLVVLAFLTFGCTKTEIHEVAAPDETQEALLGEGEQFDEIVDAIRLVRLDGTKLTLDEKPIPIRVDILVIFSKAASASERLQMEEAFKLLDGKGAEVEGSVEWSVAGDQMIFKPSRNLAYKTKYSFQIAGSDASFTTMIRGGDVNGDGYADVVASAPTHSSPAGKVYVYSGADLPGGTSAEPAFAVIPPEGGSNDHFGRSVAIAGDVNGDGYADIIVGAQYYDPSGKVYIYSGFSLSNGSLIPLATISGENVNDQFGCSVAGAGDVNGDGRDDVIVGAKDYEDPLGANTGKVYIYSGAQLSGTNPPHLAAITGEEHVNLFGASVAGAGDVDGDGRDDVIIGAPFYDRNPSNSEEWGKIYVFSGADLAGEALATMVGENAYDNLGRSVAGVGDVNNDGKDDVVAGAPNYNSVTHNNAGRIYVFSGAQLSGDDPPALATITGDINSLKIGYSVSRAGDVDGDGRDDVLAGTHEDAGLLAETLFNSYVYSGKDLTGNSPPRLATIMGHSVGGPGDVDGDGRADAVSGKKYQSEPLATQGKIYVYSGTDLLGDAPPSLATKLGLNALDEFGYSLGSVSP